MFAVADQNGVLRDADTGAVIPAERLEAAGTVQLFFPGARGWLYGMLCLPEPAVDRGLGMVLCHPFADERKRTQRLLSRTARQLASDGFTVLKPDLYGCGDSLGSFDEADLVTWQQDLLAAAQLLRRHHRVRRLGLLGIGLGATIGLLAAATEPIFDLAVLWSPCLSGRQYLRLYVQMERLWELYNRQEDSSTGPPAQDQGTARTFEGYVVSQALLDGIRAIDLLAVPRPPISSMLVLEIGKKDRLSRSFRRLGEAWAVPVTPVRGELFYGKREFSSWDELIDVSRRWLTTQAAP